MSQSPIDAEPVRQRAGSLSTYRAAPLRTLPAADRHLVRRFSWGLTPELAGDVIKAGGGRRWFEQQLAPGSVADPWGTAVDSWFPTVRASPARINADARSGVRGSWEVAVDLSRRTICRRIHSRRQVHEVMVDLWSNLLHVPLFHTEAIFWRMDYDRVIRAHALTSFDALLKATITHPAMGLFLDNAASTKRRPNENLGRELLELHTVGLEAGYTEDDVKASARILTGYRVDLRAASFGARYVEADHHVGPVRVMGFSHPNTSADGQAVTADYLTYLAHHPQTARHLARRLCVKFVADNPSESIISAVAAAYLRNKTAIKPTLRALIAHPDFTKAPSSKVRMPTEDYIASVRAVGVRLQKPTDKRSFANALYWHSSQGGQPPYEWPAPNGYPETGSAWASAGRLVVSFDLHKDLGCRFWPLEGASFPSDGSTLPTMPCSLQQLIDHLGLRLLGQKPGPEISKAVAQLLGLRLTHRLTRDDVDTRRNYWLLRRIRTMLLDSPLHLNR